jgi:hypothetical protein
MAKRSRPPKKEVIGLVGLGLDNTDGQKRITRNEDVLLVGGSQKTHEAMQEISIRFNESLQERGKQLREADVDEVLDLLKKASEK